MPQVFEVPLAPPDYNVGQSIRHVEYPTVQSYTGAINLNGNRVIEQCPHDEMPLFLKEDVHIANFHANGHLYRYRSQTEPNWSYVILYAAELIID